jgi:hypothetical protein
MQLRYEEIKLLSLVSMHSDERVALSKSEQS